MTDLGITGFARAIDAAIELLAEHGIESEDARTLYRGALDALRDPHPQKRAAARDLALTTLGPDEYLELSDILRQLRNAARRTGSDSGRYFQSVYALFGSDGMRLAGLAPGSRVELATTAAEFRAGTGADRLLVFPNEDDSKVRVRFRMWTGLSWEHLDQVRRLPVDRVPVVGDHVLLLRELPTSAEDVPAVPADAATSEERQFVVKDRLWSFASTPHECVITVEPHRWGR
ncbi:hypothetical protein SEA_PHISHY_55 [Gordonia phage Phishy]|nr:hypothetical protein SEA_PHISHY_55 [Gordonia phage Phishy]